MSSNNKDPRCFVVSASYTDIDEHVSTLSGWDMEISQLSPGQYCCDTLTIATPPYRYSFFKYSLQVLHRAYNGAGGFCFCIPLPNQHFARHLDVQVEQHVITCVPDGEKASVITPSGYEAVSFFIDAERYRQLFDHSSSNSMANKNACIYRPTGQQFKELQSALLKIRDLYRTAQNAEPASYNTVLEMTELAIIPLLLQIIANPVCDVVRPRPELFQTAVKLILNNLDSPPNIFELSCELGTSPRNLQYLFKQNIGMSPKQFIKLYRLNNARRLLWHCNPQRGKISDIANQLGFWHMGSFAQDFKRLFLKNPSDILSIAPLHMVQESNADRY